MSARPLRDDSGVAFHSEYSELIHRRRDMAHPLVEEAKSELEKAQAQLQEALNAWDSSVSELWRTSLQLTQAQKRVTYAHELLRNAFDAAEDEND